MSSDIEERSQVLAWILAALASSFFIIIILLISYITKLEELNAARKGKIEECYQSKHFRNDQVRTQKITSRSRCSI